MDLILVTGGVFRAAIRTPPTHVYLLLPTRSARVHVLLGLRYRQPFLVCHQDASSSKALASGSSILSVFCPYFCSAQHRKVASVHCKILHTYPVTARTRSERPNQRLRSNRGRNLGSHQTQVCAVARDSTYTPSLRVSGASQTHPCSG